MPEQKKTRAELKSLFVENAIPTAEDFAALIDAGLNQTDDQMDTAAGTIAVDTITSRTANTNLSLSGHGDGSVQVDDALTVAGALNANSGLTVTGAGVTIGVAAVPAAGTTPAKPEVTQPLTVIGTVTASGLVTANSGVTIAQAATTVSGLDVTFGARATAGNHPAGRPLYVSGVSNEAGAELRSADGTAGISIGSDTIQAVGTDQTLKLAGKGTGSVTVSSALKANSGLTVTGAGVTIGATAYSEVVGTVTKEIPAAPQRLTVIGPVTVMKSDGQGRGLDITYGTRTNASNHPTDRPLYVSGAADTAGVEIRNGEGTAGISIGATTIQPVGTTTNQGLSIHGKGNLGVTIGKDTSQPLDVKGALNANYGLTVTGAAVTIGVAAATGVTAAPQTLTVNGNVTASEWVYAKMGLITSMILPPTSHSVDREDNMYVGTTGTRVRRLGVRREAVLIQSDWADATMVSAGGISTPAASGEPRVSFFKDSMGIVHLRGTLSTVNMNTTTCFRLPEGCRPGTKMRFMVAAGSNFAEYTCVTIDTDGSVGKVAAGAAALDGIRFRSDRVKPSPLFSLPLKGDFTDMSSPAKTVTQTDVLWEAVAAAAARWRERSSTKIATFNGTSSRIEVSGVTAPSEFTVSMWVKMRKNAHGGWPAAMLISFGANSTYIATSSSTILCMSVSHSVPFEEGQWAHIAVVQDTERLSVYFNGLLTSSQSTRLTAGGEKAYIGCGYTGTTFCWPFTGHMMDVRFYGSALTPEEILQESY